VEKEEIITGSIDLIASVGEVSCIKFNNTLHIATITLDNGQDIIKKLNTPLRVILIYDVNHKKSSNKPIGNEQEPKGIHDVDESSSQTDNELMPDIQDNNTTNDSQINKIFRSSKQIKKNYQNNECTDEQDENQNQNSDIEQEGSNRNDSDSPEMSEIENVHKSFPTVLIEANDHQIHEIGEGATEINSDRIHEINEDASEIQSEINSERVHEIDEDQVIEAQESSPSNSKDIEADESSQSANSIDRGDDVYNENIQPSQVRISRVENEF
ncbi:17467_t:CDS:2, partial [Racocetra fulgida]